MTTPLPLHLRPIPWQLRRLGRAPIVAKAPGAVRAAAAAAAAATAVARSAALATGSAWAAPETATATWGGAPSRSRKHHSRAVRLGR